MKSRGSGFKRRVKAPGPRTASFHSDRGRSQTDAHRDDPAKGVGFPACGVGAVRLCPPSFGDLVASRNLVGTVKNGSPVAHRIAVFHVSAIESAWSCSTEPGPPPGAGTGPHRDTTGRPCPVLLARWDGRRKRTVTVARPAPATDGARPREHPDAESCPRRSATSGDHSGPNHRPAVTAHPTDDD